MIKIGRADCSISVDDPTQDQGAEPFSKLPGLGCQAIKLPRREALRGGCHSISYDARASQPSRQRPPVMKEVQLLTGRCKYAVQEVQRRVFTEANWFEFGKRRDGSGGRVHQR